MFGFVCEDFLSFFVGFSHPNKKNTQPPKFNIPEMMFSHEAMAQHPTHLKLQEEGAWFLGRKYMVRVGGGEFGWVGG